MHDFTGLACHPSTWALAAGLVVLWAVTLRLLVLRRGDGWPAIVTSLIGLFWVGFGVNIVLRFLVLAYDSYTFGNVTYRLADLPATTTDLALLLVGLYWLAATAGAAIGGRMRGTGPFGAVDALDNLGRGISRRMLGAICATSIVLSAGPIAVPLALITPLGVVGSLWTIPATLEWSDHLRGVRRRGIAGLDRWLLLAPGLVHFFLSPFREHLATLALVPFVALLLTGRRPRLPMVAATVIGLFLAATVVTDLAREVVWGQKPAGEVLEAIATPTDGERPGDAVWVQASRRFHGFDSMLLTVDLVPLVFPFSGRDVIVDGLLRGLVPRALLPDKQASDEGTRFARTIWGYHSGVESEAAIAPSMAGDLYRAGGSLYVVLGGLVWGIALGVCDAWRRGLAPAGQAAVVVLLTTLVVASVERDFAHSLASLIQLLLVLGVARLLLPRPSPRRVRAATAVAANPGKGFSGRPARPREKCEGPVWGVAS